MFRFIVSNLIIIFCVVRMISYGIYTIKEKNIAGGVSLFVLTAAATFLNYYIYR